MDQQQVVAELLMVQYLYRHTSYNQMCQADMKQVANYCKARFPNISWRELWPDIRDYMIPAIKLEALLRCDVPCPGGP